MLGSEVTSWMLVCPSSMLTTSDIAGLRDGDTLVHKRAALICWWERPLVVVLNTQRR